MKKVKGKQNYFVSLDDYARRFPNGFHVYQKLGLETAFDRSELNSANHFAKILLEIF